MPSLKNFPTAISLLIFGIICCATTALAAPVATITHLSGPLAVHKSNGVVKALSIGSQLDEGDTVVTERRTYARLKFTDGGEVTLKPNSQFMVEAYAYDRNNPQGDTGSFGLIKGGLRTITGQIGKRGNQERYRMKTPTATIGIRGTVYDAHFCQGGDCGASIEPGLYLVVAGGSVVVTNDAGVQTTLQVKAGQYVYVKDAATPPVLLPARPDIPFNPPPSVGSSASGRRVQPGAGNSDCQVR